MQRGDLKVEKIQYIAQSCHAKNWQAQLYIFWLCKEQSFIPLFQAAFMLPGYEPYDQIKPT